MFCVSLYSYKYIKLYEQGKKKYFLLVVSQGIETMHKFLYIK